MKNKPARILFFTSAFVLLSIIGLLWFIVIRETERKDLLLEYDAYRASSAIVDEYRRDQTFTPASDKRVLGFGFYRLDGTAIQSYGTARESVEIPEDFLVEKPGDRSSGLPGSVVTKFSADRKTIRLFRYSGLQNPMRMMGQDGSGQGMGRGRQAMQPAQPFPGAPQQGSPAYPQGGPNPSAAPGAAEPGGQGLLASLNSPYFIWIEYSADGNFRERFLFFLLAGAVTLALTALFVVLAFMFKHNEELKAREMETRELVQLGEAARTLVHEIKNPLGIMRIQTAGIRRAASSIRGDAGNTEEVKASAGRLLDSAGTIESEILRLSDLADRIREFLKPGPANPAPLDLLPFLRKFADRYADTQASGVSLSLALPPTGGEALALADGERLTVALDNIFRNALEAVGSLPDGQKSIAIRLYPKEAGWAIAIADSGPGVPAELQKRIFDPFFTTKEKGSGIGLALSRRIVESFGGTLTYGGNEKSKGAVFVVVLKAGKPGAAAKNPPLPKL